MSLGLKGYNTEVPGDVYSKRGTISNEGEELPVQIYVHTSKVVMPTEDQVVALMQEKGKAMLAKSSLLLSKSAKESMANGLSLLERIVISLPSKVLNGLAAEDKDLADLIRSSTEAPAKDPQTYVMLAYSLFTDELMEGVRKYIEKENKDFLTELRAHTVSTGCQELGQGRQWRMQLTVENGLIPLASALAGLFEYDVTRSRIFNLDVTGRYDKKEAQELVNAFYDGIFDGIHSHGLIMNVPAPKGLFDGTAEALDSEATKTVHRLLQFVNRMSRASEPDSVIVPK